MLHTLAHYSGLTNLSGPWYGLWSGIGSDIGEVALLAGAWAILRRHNCHVRGCWRIGHRPVEHTPYVVCHRHHPVTAPTAHAVSGHYRVAKNRAEREAAHHDYGTEAAKAAIIREALK